MTELPKKRVGTGVRKRLLKAFQCQQKSLSSSKPWHPRSLRACHLNDRRGHWMTAHNNIILTTMHNLRGLGGPGEKGKKKGEKEKEVEWGCAGKILIGLRFPRRSKMTPTSMRLAYQKMRCSYHENQSDASTTAS